MAPKANWNHILHYRGDQNHFIKQPASGDQCNANLIRPRPADLLTCMGREAWTPDKLDNTLLYYNITVTAPSRLPLPRWSVQDPLDQVFTTRKAGVYSPDSGGVRRLPSLPTIHRSPEPSGLATR